MNVKVRFYLVAMGSLITVSTYSVRAQQQSKTSEVLGLRVLSQIRDEGIQRSHVLQYASGLTDESGARLTGSPAFESSARWSIAQLKAMGLKEPHEENWGEFGIAWTQIGTSVLLRTPSPATFVAQATPWSPPTSGEVSGPVILVPPITSPEGLARWHGKLAGKIVLYGDPPPINPDPPAFFDIWDEATLLRYAHYPLRSSQNNEDNLAFIRAENFDEQVAKFFSEEHALGVLRAGGDNGSLSVQSGLSMGWFVYRPEHRQPISSAVISSEAYGRMTRLLARGKEVTVRFNLMAETGDLHAVGHNVIAEIPGTDPTLRSQVVMFGAHLDSWGGGTGATDDGAGVVLAIEAMRILTVLKVHPRRTIRIALWGGEEQGELGSLGYVADRLAHVRYNDELNGEQIPLTYRSIASVEPLKEYDDFDVYFNSDRGAGRFLGINAEGNLGAAAVFNQWLEPVRDLGFSLVSLRHTDSTDSESFDRIGLSAFDFIQSPRDDSRTHHTNLDTFERLPEADLKQAATVMATFVYLAAQREEMIPRKAKPTTFSAR